MTDYSIYDAVRPQSVGGLQTYDQIDQARYLGMRMKAVAKMNPYMGERPDALLALASSALPTTDLMQQAGAMYGMQTADTMRQQLEKMSPSTARSVFDSLSVAQQMTLTSQGYSAPQRDEEAWYEPLANIVGNVGHRALNVVTDTADFLQVDKVLDGMIWLGDQPAHLYRTIRMMDEGAQIAALGAAVLGGLAIAAAPLTGGASLVAGMGTLQALGAVGFGALGAGSLAAAATNPSDWMHAWSSSWDGERTFDRAAQARADELLGDPRLINLARDVAYQLPDDYRLSDLARAMAGDRDVSIESQVERLGKVAEQFAAKGSAQYQQVMTGLVQVIQSPVFQEAVDTLQRGKISIGRDSADFLGLNPGTGWYNLVSGAIDGAAVMALDPLLIVGRAAKAIEFKRFGMPVFSDGEAAWDHFMGIVRREPSVRAAHEQIAQAVNDIDYDLMRKWAPSMKERWGDLIALRDDLVRSGEINGTELPFTVDHFYEWLHNTQNLKPLMEGFGTVRGLNNGVILSRVSRRNEAWRAIAGRARAFTYGLTDVRFEEHLMDEIARMSDEQVAGLFPVNLFDDVSEAEFANELNVLAKQRAEFRQQWDMLPAEQKAALEERALNEGKHKFSYLPGTYNLNGTRATWNDLVQLEAAMAGHSAAHTPLVGTMIDRLLDTHNITSIKDIPRDAWSDLFQQYVMSNERYAMSRLAGRALGEHLPFGIGHGVGSLLTKMTTMVPPGSVIPLVGFDAPEAVRNFTELAALTGMPEWLRKEWANLILHQPTPGVKMNAVMSFVDNMLTLAGADALEQGVELRAKYLERIRQAYAAGGLDAHDIGTLATRQTIFLDEMADMIPMPDLTELRKSFKTGFLAHAIGLADLPMIEQFQTKVWKPSVLLRWGFIPRAAGEEFLSYMLRGGMGSLGQELGAMSIARLRRFEALKALEKEGYTITRQADLKLLAEGAMPAGLRWVSRIMGRYEWGSPLYNVIERYSYFWREALEKGIGQEQNLDRLLTGMAGSTLRLNELADDALSLAQQRAKLTTAQTARLNLARTTDSIIFGNPHSWRRMAFGGVHDDLVDAANQWWEHHGGTMMRAVGATNAGPYDPGASKQDRVRYVVGKNADGSLRTEEFQVLRGQRELRLNGDPMYENAMHHQMVRPMEDELTRTVAGPIFSLVRPDGIPVDAWHRAHQAYASITSHPARDIVEQLIYEPSWTNWQAMLQRLERTRPSLADALSRRIGRDDLSFDKVLQALYDASVEKSMDFGLGVVHRQLERFQDAQRELDGLDETYRSFIAQYLHWHGNNKSFLTSLEQEATGALIEQPRPRRVLYRGISSRNQVSLVMLPDGGVALDLHGQYQNHGDRMSISFGTTHEKAAAYADAGEGQFIVHVDWDELERQLGRTRTYDEVPWDEATGYPSDSQGLSLPAGLYPMGADEEINAFVEGPQRVRIIDANDPPVDGVGPDEFADKLDEAINDLSEALNRLVMAGDVRQVEDMIDDLDALRSLSGAERTQLLMEYSGDRFDNSDYFSTLFMRSLRNAGLLVTERVVDDAFQGTLRLPPGTWFIESAKTPTVYADEFKRLEETKQSLMASIARIENGEVVPAVGEYEALRAELEQNLDQFDKLAELEEAQPFRYIVDPDRVAEDGVYYRAFKAELDSLSDDELLDIITGGRIPEDRTPHLGATFGSAGVDSEWLFGSDTLSAYSRAFGTDDLFGGGTRYRLRGNRGVPVDAPAPGQHHFLSPEVAVIKEYATRTGQSLGEAMTTIAMHKAEKMMARYERAELFDRLTMVRGKPAELLQIGRSREMTKDQFLAMSDREATVLVADVNRIRMQRDVVDVGGSWGSKVQSQLYAPWDHIEALSEIARAGTSWGTMAPPRVGYDTWDDAAQAAEDALVYAMSEPKYASRFGHRQPDRVTSGRLAVPGETPMVHHNWVQIWMPRVDYSAHSVSFDALVQKARNPNLLNAHRAEVDAWLQGIREGKQVGFANRRLADEIANIYGDRTARSLDLPRPAMMPDGLPGVQPLLMDGDSVRVFGIDQQMWADEAFGRPYVVDTHIDDLRRATAQKINTRLKQVWTGGNEEALVPRTRTLDDGTVQSVVYEQNHRGQLVPVPVGERITSREQFYDQSGNAIEFGHGHYFERQVKYGDQGVLWPAVAPIFMDGADEVRGKALFARKTLRAEVGERVPDEHELVRAYRSNPSQLSKVARDLPNMTDGEVLQAVKESGWDRFVRYGFDRVIGPSIDALARRPMAFHFFAQRYIQNKALRDWLRDPVLIKQVEAIALRTALVDEHAVANARQVAGYARTLGRYTGAEHAADWTEVGALAWLRGHEDLPGAIAMAQTRIADDLRRAEAKTAGWTSTTMQSRLQELRQDELAMKQLARRDVDELRTVLPPQMRDVDFLAYVRSEVKKGSMLDEDFFQRNKDVLANHPVLGDIPEDAWDVILRAERQYQNITREVGEYAAIAAINDMLPFIDSHEFKTQFADYGKGFLPFWYAEENFMKRWARTIALEPTSIRKLQLTYMGLKTAGVVRTDSNGKDWFVYPGSNLLQEAINKIPGLPDLPVGVMFQSPTDMMLPGMNSRFGVPQFGPLVTIPIDLLSVPMPELVTMERQLLGDVAASKSALEQIIPTPLMSTFRAVLANDSDQRYASAQLAAIAELEAQGNWINESDTPGQIDDKLDMVREHARIILFSQAVSGWFTPGPATQFNTGPDAAESGMGLTDPANQLNTMYLNLLQDLGVEEGTKQFLRLVPLSTVADLFNYTRSEDGSVEYLDGSNPLAYTVSKNASQSGAPLPATEYALAFFDENSDYMAEFPNAGPWLLPNDPNITNQKSQYAYNAMTLNGLRKRRTPEEFLSAIKFKKAAGMYFEQRTQYQDAVEQARANNDTTRVRLLNERWDVWSATYRAAHPVFAEQLESSDARQRRARTIDEMRVIVRDENGPRPPHFAVLQQMMDDYDLYLTLKAEYSLDRSADGRAKVEILKGNFERRMNEIVLTNPVVQSFWVGVLRPEAALD